ncbi:Signal transduction histidine kinase [Paractinoplanes atraurantiacus]|uniref:histidine kinase n=1 Tax=Paractinoplanes atraurantiacus TaxID=1036182 RepID=A0A285HIA7_9ACTN|nr:Signal transduction histidine kinase [Actinoplanes atraurantiacus]
MALVHSSPIIAWRLAFLATLVTVPPEVVPGGLAWPWHPIELLVLPGTVLAVALRHRPSAVSWAAALSCVAMLLRVSPQDAVTVIVLITLVAVTGVQVRRRVVARQTAEQTRRALAEQRTLLARELHDVVGHHMSLIAVRAESAPYRLDSHPEARNAEFTAIAGASRDALNDMRRLVGHLSTTSDPGGVGSLVDRARAAGMKVSAHLDSSVESTVVAVRVVQEALTNAARHAPGSEVTVNVALVDGAIHIDISNTAATRPALSGPPGGNGLPGMRHRVTSLGGTFHAGPTFEGGYRVEVIVPLS